VCPWLEAFPGSPGSATSVLKFPRARACGLCRGICLPAPLHAWTGSTNRPLRLPLCVTPSLLTVHTGTGISTGCPSPTPLGLGLGPDSPWADDPCPGNLRLSAARILTELLATQAGIRSSEPSTARSRTASPALRTLPYHAEVALGIRSFGDGLSPAHCRRRFTRPVSYYALFK
jgi:hypothetical protein